MEDAVLDALVALSNRLGDPARDYAILGEGNTSARADTATFWVKASGAELRTAGPDRFVRVRFDAVLEMLETAALDDDAVRSALARAKADAGAPAHPSVETLLHAVCLGVPGVNVVAHTHPTAVNALACSRSFPDALRQPLFPDQVVVCGVAPVLVPYVDPGVPLAREVDRLVRDFVAEHGDRPRVLYLQNHGLVALGASVTEAENVTAMAVKAARVLLGTYAAGGPVPMTEGAVARIHGRPDEHHRQRVLGQR